MNRQSTTILKWTIQTFCIKIGSFVRFISSTRFGFFLQIKEVSQSSYSATFGFTSLSDSRFFTEFPTIK